MVSSKSLTIVWSKSAVKAAGTNIHTLHRRLTGELSEIVSQTFGKLLHSIPGKDEVDCFLCNAFELPDTWKVFVQCAVYVPMPSIRSDHPDPELRNKVMKFPEALADTDNKLFASYAEITGN